MLELLDDGTLRFRTIVLLVARQNGKSTISRVLALWFMVVWGWPLVLGTAQDLDVAEEIWQGAVDLLEDDEELADLVKRVVKVNGKKSLELHTGSRYKVKAASRRAGRGLTGNLILLDELREHQTWDAWGAITKTTMAQAEALVMALSNAGDAASIVLRYLRKMGHAAVGDPDGICANDDPATLLPSPAEIEHDDEDDVDVDDFEQDADSLGIFEWSAPPECDVRDRDAWAMANPSLGYGITERTIAAAAATDPEWVFRTEVLCQWLDDAEDGPFPPGAWQDCTDVASALADEASFAFCVDVSWDRTMAHIAVAGLRDDGRIHVEVIASRAGTDWVLPWLKSAPKGRTVPRMEQPGLLGVALQVKGAPVSSMVKDLTDAGVPVIEWIGSDLGPATGAFYDAVRHGQLRHRPQPILDVPAATAHVKPLSDGFVWDRKSSPVDAAPLVAATGAVWAAKHTAVEAPPPPAFVFGL